MMAEPHINDVPLEDFLKRRDVVGEGLKRGIQEHQGSGWHKAFFVQSDYWPSAEHVDEEGQGAPHQPDEAATARFVGRGMLRLGCVAGGCAHGVSVDELCGG